MELPLREIKYAKTKFEIVEAAWEHLENASFETCSVKDLCKKVHISEATFFNYFPKKEHLLFYMGQVETTKMILRSISKHSQAGLERLKWLVHFMAKDMEENLKPMLEFIFTMSRLSAKIERVEFTPAEISLFFENSDPEDFQSKDLGEEILANIVQAQHDGDIPNSVNAIEVTYSILAMTVGIPMVLQMKKMHECELTPIYNSEIKITSILDDNLEMILKGIGAKL